MLRTLLVGILALSATAACGSKEDAPAAVPGAPAGKVVELTGTVTATRGTEVRTLAPGGEISADDVIGTAAESRVAILLDHNNARWDLGPNRTVKVGESLAWTAAKQAGPAAVVKEETSTAGRHAEKTAATTTTTTARQSESRDEAAAAPAAAAAPPPAAEPAEPVTDAKVTSAAPTKSAKADSRRAGVAKNSAPGASPSPPPPPPAARPAPSATFGGENEERKSVATTESAKVESSRDLDKEDDAGPDLQSKGGGGAGGGGGGGARHTTPLEIEIRGTLEKQKAALKVCLGTDLTRLVLRVTVTNGTYTIQTSDPKATAETRACLAKIAKSLKATATGTSTVPHAIAK